MKLDVKKLRLRLEEAGFSFYEDTKKSRCYKKNGVPIYVTKNNTAPESYIISILSQAGLSREEITAFIKACRG